MILQASAYAPEATALPFPRTLARRYRLSRKRSSKQRWRLLNLVSTSPRSRRVPPCVVLIGRGTEAQLLPPPSPPRALFRPCLRPRSFSLRALLNSRARLQELRRELQAHNFSSVIAVSSPDSVTTFFPRGLLANAFFTFFTTLSPQLTSPRSELLPHKYLPLALCVVGVDSFLGFAQFSFSLPFLRTR